VPKVRARDAHPDAPPRRPLVLTEAFAEPAAPYSEEPAVAATLLLRAKPLQTPAEADVADAAPEPATRQIFVLESEAEAEPEAAPAVLDLTESDADYAEAALETAPFSHPLQPESAPLPRLLAATPQFPSGFTLPLPRSDAVLVGEPYSPVASVPLDALGLVQLIERLALAIAARKAAADAGPPPPPESETVTETIPETKADPLSSASVASSPPADDAATLAKLGASEPDGSARQAILRRLGAAAAEPAPTGEAPTAQPTAQPIAQPLATKTSAPGPFSAPSPQSHAVVPWPTAERRARAGAEPAPAPSDPGSKPFTAPPPSSAATASVPFEADSALRAALATLQRMSARA
jgi:hypothetical protein